jgi:hypothetical protein
MRKGTTKNICLVGFLSGHGRTTMITVRAHNLKTKERPDDLNMRESVDANSLS